MKLLKLTLSMFILIGVFSSCVNENENENLPEKFEINKITNTEIINGIKTSYNKKSNSKTNSSEFNFENIKEIYNTETEAISYIVNSKDNQNLKLGFYPSVDGGYTIFKVEQIVDGDTAKIIYRDVKNIIFSEVVFNLTDQTVSVKSYNNSNKQVQGCGQAVADCIDENYNHTGWYGVAGYVISIFNPWFGVAVVAGCAAIVC
jgi:hypothetical protein